jgi:hypothetical protein
MRWPRPANGCARTSLTCAPLARSCPLGVNCGQVRGPVQLTFARSVEPIVALEHSITRMAVATEAEAEKQQGDNRTMGRKHTVPYGVYVAHGFVSSFLAKQTGFGEDDLELVFQALAQMFEHDRSAARGEMSTRGLYVFKHDSELGNAPAHALFDRLKVEPKAEGEVARSFDAYSVAFDGQSLAVGQSVQPTPGVTLDPTLLIGSNMKILPTEFDGQSIRRVYDESTETWWFSVIDVVQVLTQQADDLTARKYWNQLKRRLANEGSQLVTSCHQLKMPAADGKQRLTDVATAETLLRLVQSIPSPKAEPIKLWLAKVGYERMQEMADPALSLDRARQTWQQHGRSDKWIQQRMTGQETRNKLTDYWSEHDIKKGSEFAILTNIIHQEWAGVSVASTRT